MIVDPLMGLLKLKLITRSDLVMALALYFNTFMFRKVLSKLLDLP